MTTTPTPASPVADGGEGGQVMSDPTVICGNCKHNLNEHYGIYWACGEGTCEGEYCRNGDCRCQTPVYEDGVPADYGNGWTLQPRPAIAPADGKEMK